MRCGLVVRDILVSVCVSLVKMLVCVVVCLLECGCFDECVTVVVIVDFV